MIEVTIVTGVPQVENFCGPAWIKGWFSLLFGVEFAFSRLKLVSLALLIVQSFLKSPKLIELSFIRTKLFLGKYFERGTFIQIRRGIVYTFKYVSPSRHPLLRLLHRKLMLFL